MRNAITNGSRPEVLIGNKLVGDGHPCYIVAEIGIEPIVFGSDFPHGEGLAYPDQYVGAQLNEFNADDQRKIMRDNLENFLTFDS